MHYYIFKDILQVIERYLFFLSEKNLFRWVNRQYMIYSSRTIEMTLFILIAHGTIRGPFS